MDEGQTGLFAMSFLTFHLLRSFTVWGKYFWSIWQFLEKLDVSLAKSTDSSKKTNLNRVLSTMIWFNQIWSKQIEPDLMLHNFLYKLFVIGHTVYEPLQKIQT